MGRLTKYLKYLPAAWVAIKIMWTLYKSKIRADGYREALKDEQHKRIRAEAKVALDKRLASSDADRLSKLRAESKDRNPS